MDGSHIGALVYLTGLLLGSLSGWWTARKARQIMGEALGRPIRAGEECSLRSWMSLDDSRLATAPSELSRNPFQLLELIFPLVVLAAAAIWLMWGVLLRLTPTTG